MSSLRVSGLHASYGADPVLRGVDLTLDEDRLLAVLGPSGCGKSTLVRVLAGFLRPTAGTVTVGGRTLDDGGRHVPAERRRITVVPQEGALFPHLTVAQNIGFGLRGRAGAPERVRELLEVTAMAAQADRYPRELSGGQQQRVSVARALAPRPEFVLLDEPFSALDAGLRTHLRSEVIGLLRAEKASAILVTHDQSEALSVADEVAVLRDGRLQQQGTPAELYRRPASRWIAEFVGDAVILPAEIRAGLARTPLGDLPLAEGVVGEGDIGDVVEVMLRLEQLEFGDRGIPVEVVDLTYYGHESIVVARLPQGQTVRVRLGGAAPGIGETSFLRVRGTAHPLSIG